MFSRRADVDTRGPAASRSREAGGFIRSPEGLFGGIEIDENIAASGSKKCSSPPTSE